MTLGPLLVDGLHPIIGPLRVDPHNYPDDVNGTISDASFTTKNKEYMAWVDDSESLDVAFYKTSPFWAHHPLQSTHLGIMELWNCGSMQAEYNDPLPNSLWTNTSGAMAGRADGNGYFYLIGVGYGGVSYEHRIRRLLLDATYDEVTINWKTTAPATDWFGNAYDRNHGSVVYQPQTLRVLAQEDGILVSCIVTIPAAAYSVDPGYGATRSYQLWVYVDEDLNVGTAWWTTYAVTDAITFQPIPIHPIGITTTVSPLSHGFIGVYFDDIGPPFDHKFYTVDQSGAKTGPVTVTIHDDLRVSTHTWFHTDGSFWVQGATNRYLFSAAFSDDTPGWTPNLSAAQTFAVTAEPISSSHFRFMARETVSGSVYYRVRDNSGAILVEKLATSSPPPDSTTPAGANTTTNVQQTADNKFVFVRPAASYSSPGVYKFAADNLVCSLLAGQRTGAWTRGQWAHFDYSDWPES